MSPDRAACCDMGAHEAERPLSEDAALQSDDDRRARVSAITRHISENSKDLLERLARWDEHGSKPTYMWALSVHRFGYSLLRSKDRCRGIDRDDQVDLEPVLPLNSFAYVHRTPWWGRSTDWRSRPPMDVEALRLTAAMRGPAFLILVRAGSRGRSGIVLYNGHCYRASSKSGRSMTVVPKRGDRVCESQSCNSRDLILTTCRSGSVQLTLGEKLVTRRMPKPCRIGFQQVRSGECPGARSTFGIARQL
jgi:hypothetical protein